MINHNLGWCNWKFSNTWSPGGCLNMKILSYQYRKYHGGIKTILWLSYLDFLCWQDDIFILNQGPGYNETGSCHKAGRAQVPPEPGYGFRNSGDIWGVGGQIHFRFHSLCTHRDKTMWLFHGTLCINGLVQERCNSIANALELRLSCTKPSVVPETYMVSHEICTWVCRAFFVPTMISVLNGFMRSISW